MVSKTFDGGSNPSLRASKFNKMGKSFFDTSMTPQMTTQQTQGVDISSIFNALYQLPQKAHFCHHLTTSFAAHKALDFAYEKLNDLKDDIVEQIIGYTGQRFSTISLKPLTGYSEAMNVQLAREIMSFGEQLEEWAEANDYCNIENLAQEYSGVGAKLNYLLTLK